MKSSTHEGRVLAPALLYASLGLLVSFVISWLGFLKRTDENLIQILADKAVFGENVALVPVWVIFLVTAAFCLGLAFAVLDSPSLWRRLILCFVSVLIVVTTVPTLAICGFYFSPFISIIAVFWTAFCTIMYTRHHIMPADKHGVESSSGEEPVTHG